MTASEQFKSEDCCNTKAEQTRLTDTAYNTYTNTNSTKKHKWTNSTMEMGCLLIVSSETKLLTPHDTH